MTTPPRGTGENLLPECCGRHGTSQSYYCGLCPLDEALAEYVGNPAQRRIVLDRLTTLRARAERAEGALEPFAHPDLLKMTGGQCQGDDSPVYGRDNAVLKLGHFRAAARALAARGE